MSFCRSPLSKNITLLIGLQTVPFTFNKKSRLFFSYCDTLHNITLKRRVLVGIAWPNGIYHVHSAYNLPKDCVAAVELWLGSKGNKELAAVGIWPGIRHRDHTGFIESQVTRFIDKLITWSSLTSTSRVPALRHETFQYTVKGHAVVESLTGKKNKTVYRYGRLVRK